VCDFDVIGNTLIIKKYRFKVGFITIQIFIIKLWWVAFILCLKLENWFAGDENIDTREKWRKHEKEIMNVFFSDMMCLIEILIDKKLDYKFVYVFKNNWKNIIVLFLYFNCL